MLTRTPLAGGTRPAFALHLGIVPVQIQIQRAANARAQVAAADREAARRGGWPTCLSGGLAKVVCVNVSNAARQATIACAMKHASTVARALYCKKTRTQWPNAPHAQLQVDTSAA